MIQQVNPDMALHYWDWTQDPRAADDGQGGTVNLSAMFDSLLAGTATPEVSTGTPTLTALADEMLRYCGTP